MSSGSWSTRSSWAAGSACLRTKAIRKRWSSWTRRPSARASSTSPTGRRTAEAIRGPGYLILAPLLPLCTTFGEEVFSQSAGDCHALIGRHFAQGAPRCRPSVVVARRLGRDVAVLQRRFENPAAVELADRGAVDLLPGCAALRVRRDTFLLAAFDLFVGHEHVAAARAQVYAYHITGPQPGQAAAGGALGRGVEDRGAV